MAFGILGDNGISGRALYEKQDHYIEWGMITKRRGKDFIYTSIRGFKWRARKSRRRILGECVWEKKSPSKVKLVYTEEMIERIGRDYMRHQACIYVCMTRVIWL